VTDQVKLIADAVLYEGYILWPYRRSALKNAKRWTFGGVYPRAYSESGHPDDAWRMQTQCLAVGDGSTRADVRVRFLHVVDRRVLRATESGLEPVDELTVGAERHLSWEEATDPAGGIAGALRRTARGLAGTVEVHAQQVRPGVHRLTVAIANTTPWDGGTRDAALERTFVSTHTIVRLEGGELASLTDPPEDLRELAGGCENVGTWPVLVGGPGDRTTLLSSPIILEDYPRIAPESPGDLFDGGEIDELLTLNILGLTDEEKREMRDSDPRAREILDRTARLTPEEIMRLHGAVRDFGALRER
jgi:hypothetical protein